MSQSEKLKHIQGRVNNAQIATNLYLQKAILRGDAEAQRLIKNALEVTANYGDYEPEDVERMSTFLNTILVDQALKENEDLSKKVDWLLDMIGELLKSHNPEDAKQVRNAIRKVKKGEV